MVKIMVVDDEENWLFLLTEILQDAGYSVNKANSEQSAKIALQEEEFDLVVIDIRLDTQEFFNDSGFDVLTFARKLDKPPHIILITAHIELAKRAMGQKEYAPDAFVEKVPFNISKFIRQVECVLN